MIAMNNLNRQAIFNAMFDLLIPVLRAAAANIARISRLIRNNI